MYKSELGLIFFPAFDWKISSTHPERQERLLYTRNQIEEEGLLDHPAIREYNPIVASYDSIEQVHVGVPSLEDWVTPAHQISAGGAIVAADSVLSKDVRRAFALVRPPGHHAMSIVHGIRGFCTINSEAIMVQHIRKVYGIQKIAIVDTDVHHGDGTQDIFYHDPDTLYISFHQDGRTLYPGTGFMNEFGGPQAIGATVNIPLPPGTGDEGLKKVMTELVLPMIHDFGAEIIINSAGQDNHFSDPLANMNVTAKGYAELVDILDADIAVLEGGYSVQDALPYINTAIILSMAGLDYSKVIEPAFDKDLYGQSADVTRYIDMLIDKWKLQWDDRHNLQKNVSVDTGDYWKNTREIYYDESGIRETRSEVVRMYHNSMGWHSIMSTGRGGPYGHQSVYAMFIPWQANKKCRDDAYDVILKEKQYGNAQRYVIVDPMGVGQEEI
ncbi:histone deacetylase family protein [Veillonella montpellierensis]|uniref:histone deacetylase family protein n=1 Tax=Veillonella montpellierensis TaxID=187328 RepID=UPI000416BB0B|nr:histone deacetylase [Veillonella montpellierensis]